LKIGDAKITILILSTVILTVIFLALFEDESKKKKFFSKTLLFIIIRKKIRQVFETILQLIRLFIVIFVQNFEEN